MSAKSGTENSGGRWHGEKRVITQQSLVDRRLRKKKKKTTIGFSLEDVLGGSAVFVEVGACFGRLRGEGGEG